MRKVRGPADRLQPDEMAGIQPSRIILERAHDIAAKIGAGALLDDGLVMPALLEVVEYPLRAAAHIRHPADIALNIDHLQIWIAIESARPHDARHWDDHA